MDESLLLNGEKFISSKRAAEITGYAQDYIGQLARENKVDARRIGRSWYVSEKSLIQHEESHSGSYEEEDEALASSEKNTSESKGGGNSGAVAEENPTPSKAQKSSADEDKRASSRDQDDAKAESAHPSSEKTSEIKNSDAREVEIDVEKDGKTQEEKKNFDLSSSNKDGKKTAPETVLEAAGGMYSYHRYDDPSKTNGNGINSTPQAAAAEEDAAEVPVEHARPATAEERVSVHRQEKGRQPSPQVKPQSTHRVVRRPIERSSSEVVAARTTQPPKKRGRAVLVGIVVITTIAFIGTLASGFLLTQEVAYNSASEVEQTKLTSADFHLSEIKAYIRDLLSKIR